MKIHKHRGRKVSWVMLPALAHLSPGQVPKPRKPSQKGSFKLKFRFQEWVVRPNLPRFGQQEITEGGTQKSSSFSTLVSLGCPSPQITHTHSTLQWPAHSLETAGGSNETAASVYFSRPNAMLGPEHSQEQWTGLLLRAEDGGDSTHLGADSPVRKPNS